MKVLEVLMEPTSVHAAKRARSPRRITIFNVTLLALLALLAATRASAQSSPPYEAPEPYATQYASTPYVAEIAYTDAVVGRLTAWLRQNGQLERTVIVVTSVVLRKIVR